MGERFTRQDLRDSTKLADIERRSPVVSRDRYQELFSNDIERHWSILTELVRAELSSHVELQVEVARFANVSVTEQLPKQFLQAVFEVHPDIAKRCTRFRHRLEEFLGLDSVPDEQLSPDVKSAPGLDSPEELLRSLDRSIDLLDDGRRRDEYEEELIDQLERARRGKWFLKGVSLEEKRLVLRRYRFARDVKLLALGAELSQPQQPPFIPGNELYTKRLLSGIEIHLIPTEVETGMSLLSPQCWEKRTEIKDRVFRIEMRGKKYILKERKTPRHRDTSSNGDRYNETNTSQEECLIALQLQKEGRKVLPEIQVSWEKPMGYVVFPDGFQFTVFDYEENLLAAPEPYAADEESVTRTAIQQAIARESSYYQTEYEAIQLLLKRFTFDPRIMDTESVSGYRISNEVKAFAEGLFHPLQLSFEEFTAVKAQRLIERACVERERMMAQCHVVDRDRGRQYAFRLKQDVLPVKLEIIGFDFEFCEISLPRNDQQALQAEEYRKSLYASGNIFKGWTNKNGWMNKVQKAAYLTMYALEEDIEEERLRL